MSKLHRKLIRRPGGAFASKQEIETIRKLHARSKGRKTYKELSADYFGKQGYQPPQWKRRKDKLTNKDIMDASKDLGMSVGQVKELYGKKKIRVKQSPYKMLSALGSEIGGNEMRKPNMIVHFTPVGERRRTYKQDHEAQTFEAIANVFQQIRSDLGLKANERIPSEALPWISIQETYTPPDQVPDAMTIDLNQWIAQKDLPE